MIWNDSKWYSNSVGQLPYSQIKTIDRNSERASIVFIYAHTRICLNKVII